jgi:hypothetical protein
MLENNICQEKCDERHGFVYEIGSGAIFYL